MTDERKQRISAIYASVKALTPEQKEKENKQASDRSGYRTSRTLIITT